MTTMVEKMARAMWESHPNHEPWDARRFDTVSYMIYAKEALHAMQTPTEAMKQAGGPVTYHEYSRHYRAMIQAALDEKEA